MCDTKKCKGCQFWKCANGDHGYGNEFRFCHYLLITGKRRVEKDGICYSYEKKQQSYGH